MISSHLLWPLISRSILGTLSVDLHACDDDSCVLEMTQKTEILDPVIIPYRVLSSIFELNNSHLVTESSKLCGGGGGMRSIRIIDTRSYNA